MLRYALRVNSTKVKPTVWQMENLPQSSEDSPWMATYVSPLYSVFSNSGCFSMKELVNAARSSEPNRPSHRSLSLSAFNKDYWPCCAQCFVKCVDLKRCKRCHHVSYCSVNCQKNHWLTHKVVCDFAFERSQQKK